MCTSSFSPVPFSFLSVFYSTRTNLRCAAEEPGTRNAARAGAANRLRGRVRGTDAPSTATASCSGATNADLWAFIRLAVSIKSSDRAELASGGSKLASDRTELESGRVMLTSGGSKLASNCTELESDRFRLTSGGSKLKADRLWLASDCTELVSDSLMLTSGDAELAPDGAELGADRLKSAGDRGESVAGGLSGTDFSL